MEITWVWEVVNLVLVPLTGIVTWLVARRKRDNDFLHELQASVNLLLQKNRELTEEVVQLRAENADLKAMVNELNLRLDASRITDKIRDKR